MVTSEDAAKIVPVAVWLADGLSDLDGDSVPVTESDISALGLDAIDVVAKPLAGLEAGFFFFLLPAIAKKLGATFGVLAWGLFHDGGAFLKICSAA
jgi:hypothetical protein